MSTKIDNDVIYEENNKLFQEWMKHHLFNVIQK